MNKKLLSLMLFVAVAMQSYAQSQYEKGYFINLLGKKVECLIYNIDWKNNPTKFSYKVDETSEILNESIDKVSEFGIDSGTKYVRSTVEIDRSSEDVKKMSKDRNPVYKNETLFLQTISEGAANLYYYRDGDLKRYFFKVGDAPIKQFVYKRYRLKEGNIAENTFFKQQIMTDLACNTITQKEVEKLRYELKDFEAIISKYNRCQGGTSTVFNQKEKRDLFNLTIRPGVNFADFSVTNSKILSQEVDFDKQTSLRLGVELEYIIPYHNNAWSLILEPTYHYYKAEQLLPAGNLVAKLDYKTIELPLGVRRTFFLNDNSRVFVNAQFVLTLDLDATYKYYDLDGSVFKELEVNSGKNFAFGAGYKFLDKYSIELRYQTNRRVLDRYYYYESKYGAMSVILGYNFL